MRFVVHRRLALPLCAVAFFAVALTAPPPAAVFLMPPTTLFVIAALGIAAVLFAVPGALPSLRTSRSLVRVPPSVRRDQTSPGIVMAAAICVRTLEGPSRNAAGDALDLVRMDDDGAWQMTRPRA